MIGTTGSVGGGAPSTNDTTETIDGYIEGRSLVEIKIAPGSRGVLSEVPTPTYGYMRKDEFYHMGKDEDLINDWVVGALGGLIHTDRKGRSAGKETPICQIPWGTQKSRVRVDGT